MQMECVSIEWMNERMNYASFVGKWNYSQRSIDMAVREADATKWKQNKWSHCLHAICPVDIRVSHFFETGIFWSPYWSTRI